MRIKRDDENQANNVHFQLTTSFNGQKTEKKAKTLLESKLEQLEKKQYELTKKVSHI
jgi:hypothetical protein